MNKSWVLKTVSEKDRSYESIEAYDDVLSQKYVYDNFVANFKQMLEGDKIILINKKKILGFARIEEIRSFPSTKLRRSCPECKNTNYESRQIKTPKYRCNKGHEFDLPKEKTVDSIVFEAYYGNSFTSLDSEISINEIRLYYKSGYNRNMSIQLLSSEVWDNITEISSRGRMVEYNSSEYTPTLEDLRLKIERSIASRPGQVEFKKSLILIYGAQCMISGFETIQTIQAAHIVPYRSENDNDPSNGLLLRADLHIVFDLNLMGINPSTLKVKIHRSMRNSDYQKLDGRTLIIPSTVRPNYKALELRWNEFLEKI